jgi:hypothetical protein
VAVAVESEQHDIIKFVIVEEYLDGDNSMSLKALMAKVGEDKLMRKYFSERSYIMRLIIQILKGLLYLNGQ